MIIWDNGHGEDTKGKRSPDWSNGQQLFEWEFNRDIVDQIQSIMVAERYDSEILVPETKDIPIRERVERANEIHKADDSILISVHGNAAPNADSKPHGVETFHYSLGGKVLAKELQQEVVNITGWKDRGVRQAYKKIKTKEKKTITIYKIAILKYTNMLSALTENGFYTNFEQCQQMMDVDIRSSIALAHVKAVKQYLFHLTQ